MDWNQTLEPVTPPILALASAIITALLPVNWIAFG